MQHNPTALPNPPPPSTMSVSRAMEARTRGPAPALEASLAPTLSVGSLHRSGETFTVIGSGDIASSEANGGSTIEHVLIGAVAGLIVVMVVAVLFVTASTKPMPFSASVQQIKKQARAEHRLRTSQTARSEPSTHVADDDVPTSS